MQMIDFCLIDIKSKGLIALRGVAKGERKTNIAKANYANGGGGC
jgi:hypothetical protein